MTVVRIDNGRVRGGTRAGIRFFHAIPYACAPRGPSRFQPPQPAEKWDGIRDATTPGPTAPMARRDFGAVDLRPVLGDGWTPGAEYLTVSVTTPDPSRAVRCPVLVFLHGGGFTAGTGQAALYDGASFANDGVVLVTLNYRLGITGWLDVPGAPRNRGLLDVLAALRWVAKNIAAFGGDPANVTLAGQSAGAMIVSALLVTPEAGGLFRRAISQSGSGECGFVAEQAKLVTDSVTAVLGAPATAGVLGQLDDARLAEAGAELGLIDHAAHGFRDTSLGSSPFKPVLDRQPTEAARAGDAAEVDLLIGTNTEEANLYLVPSGAVDNLDEQRLLGTAKRRFTEPEATLERYRARYPGASAGTLAAQLITDAFTASNRGLARAHADAGNRTYAYEFAWRSPALAGRLGACHCVELPFVFDRLDLPELYGEKGLLGGGPADAELARRMHSAWVSFATLGDPGWPAYPAGPVTRFGPG